MSEPQSSPRQMLEANLDLIRELIRYTSRRNRLRSDEEEEFASYVWLKMVEGDGRILRGFRGRSSLRTFLVTVVHRLLLDYRAQTWGKWRPSAEARRLGGTAVELDRLLWRDGLSVDSAVEILERRGGGPPRGELLALAARLPARGRPRRAGEELLHRLPAAEGADERLLARESRAARSKARGSLMRALGKLPAPDRLILKLRYEDGLTVRKIASLLRVEDGALYRRFDRTLNRLRTTLEDEGTLPC